MHEFDQSDSVKERNDSNNTCYQISMHYKEIENAFIKKIIVVYFLLSLLQNQGNAWLRSFQ